jgi:endogenous inhibitor of DNA gyrase (YacG/DUF329 family)
MTAKCPYCGGETTIDASNRFRPFCSERCKMIDLSHWISGTYRIPEKENADEDAHVEADDQKDPDKK